MLNGLQRICIFSKNTGVMRAKYGQYSSCCDFVVYFNLLSVIGLFTKQFNNALNLHKITKIRVKSQKHGRYTGDFPQRPLYMGMLVYGRLSNPGYGQLFFCILQSLTQILKVSLKGTDLGNAPACVNNTNLVCFEYRVWVSIMNMIIGFVGILNMIIGSVGILIGLLVF